MSSTTRDGTDAAIHFHIWRGVLKENGDLTQRNRITGYWRTRSSANQWLRKAGRRGAARPRVEQCDDLGTCRAKPFDASLRNRSPKVRRLTQELVDTVEVDNSYVNDGAGLRLYVHTWVNGRQTRTFVQQFRLRGNLNHITLGPASALTLEKARALSAAIMSEVRERRRLLSEGLDNGETNAAFLARMQQPAADAVEGEDNGADKDTAR